MQKFCSHHREISIHTPAWGATTRDHTVPYNVVIFQSTLPRGERRYPPASVFLVENFNPHSRVGSDKIYLMQIHPVKNFNPHSRVGSDKTRWRIGLKIFLFQSTLPRGERLCRSDLYQRLQKFQSTLPRGERRATKF